MTSIPPRATRSPRPAPAAAPRSRARSRAGVAELGASPPASAAERSRATLADAVREQWIAEAAYFIAERRGFHGGSPEDDWFRAEVEIDQMLAGPPH